MTPILVETFEPPMRGVLHERRNGFDLFLHQVAEHLVLREELGDDVSRSVLAVGRAERIVDIAVGIRRQLFSKIFLRPFLESIFGCFFLLFREALFQVAGFALLLGVETQVFEQHHLAGLQVLGHFGRLVAHAVACESDFGTEHLLDGADNLTERVFGVGILLGTSEVRHQNDRTACVEHLFDRRRSRPDAGVVRHVALLVEGHVEVHADNGAFPFEIVTFDSCHIIS